MMLILTRRFGQSIMIGKDGEIKITVLSHNGAQIKIGIDAPANIPVHREEIFLRIQEEKKFDGSSDDDEEDE